MFGQFLECSGNGLMLFNNRTTVGENGTVYITGIPQLCRNNATHALCSTANSTNGTTAARALCNG